MEQAIYACNSETGRGFFEEVCAPDECSHVSPDPPTSQFAK
jgi:hypothetical protein